jgi:phosphopantothenoylcysteine decarboxylase/phosphopantothenate--cysteine ligase
MLQAATAEFRECDGLIGVAAPCDYRPVKVQSKKISKTGGPLMLKLVETPDVVATLGARKQGQWVVGFALETEDHRFRALTKLERKSCDLMVLNGPEAISASHTRVELIDPAGDVVAELSGGKEEIARQIFRVIQERLLGG